MIAMRMSVETTFRRVLPFDEGSDPGRVRCGRLRRRRSTKQPARARPNGHVPGLTPRLPSGALTDASADPTIRRLRAEIARADDALLDAFNRRLQLVAELRRYKAAQGIEFVDPEQERRLVVGLLKANSGPLSSGGLKELFAYLLELTKREVEGL